MMDAELFQKKLNAAFDEIGREHFAYDESEFWMYIHTYHYMEEYATENQLWNTLIALPMVRSLHNGVHRKGTVMIDGHAYHMPYVVHCLRVCQMLFDLHVPLSHEEKDILLASALCHDVIEDVPFPNGGTEMVTLYKLDPRIYENVKTVSKRNNFTEEEHQAYFDRIQENPFALLVKLSDRGSNVEDTYNMSIWKVHEYIAETRKYFFPMCDYGIAHYPELYGVFAILRDKMKTLTESAETLVVRFEEKESALTERLNDLQRENNRLRALLKEVEVIQ